MNGLPTWRSLLHMITQRTKDIEIETEIETETETETDRRTDGQTETWQGHIQTETGIHIVRDTRSGAKTKIDREIEIY